MKHRKNISAAILVLTILIDIVCLHFLPPEVTICRNDNGTAAVFLSKYALLLIGYAVTLLFLWLWSAIGAKTDGSFSGSRSGKGLCIITNTLGFALSCSGIVLGIVLLARNEYTDNGESSQIALAILWPVLFFALQFILCFHVRNKFVKCIPLYLSGAGILYTAYLFFDPVGTLGGWHELGALIIGIIVAYATAGVILAWLMYYIVRLVEKRKK